MADQAGISLRDRTRAVAHESSSAVNLRLANEVDPQQDHVRGTWTDDSVVVVAYQDFLCPYCRRLRPVFRRLQSDLGGRLVYVFRHFPNERANPGADLASRAA